MDPEWCLSATDGVEAKGCSAHRTDSDQIIWAFELHIQIEM